MNKELPAKSRVIFKHLHIFGFSAGYTDNICRLSLPGGGLFTRRANFIKARRL